MLDFRTSQKLWYVILPFAKHILAITNGSAIHHREAIDLTVKYIFLHKVLTVSLFIPVREKLQLTEKRA